MAETRHFLPSNEKLTCKFGKKKKKNQNTRWISSTYAKMRLGRKNEHTGRISLCRRWSGLGRGEKKKDLTGNPCMLAGSLSIAGGQGERKRDLAGKPRTLVGSLSVPGGQCWVGVREREIRPKTHAHRPDLSVVGGRDWVG
jgi:hypothetical protein